MVTKLLTPGSTASGCAFAHDDPAYAMTYRADAITAPNARVIRRLPGPAKFTSGLSRCWQHDGENFTLLPAL